MSRRVRCQALIAALLLACGGAGAAQPPADADELFRKIFKRERPPPPPAVYPILVDERERGATRVQLRPAPGDTELAPEGVLRALQGLAEPEVLRQLRSAAEDDLLTLTELSAAGLGATFDRQLLVLRLEVPLALRTVQTLEARGRHSPQLPDDLHPPARLSALVNLRGALTHVQHSEFEPAGWLPAAVGLDAAVRIDRVVMEAGATYDGNSDRSEWRREELLFTFDDPPRAVRYQLGDIRSSTDGFQSALELGGLRIAREFRLQPYVDFRPSEQRDFELLRPSRVGVLVNGVLVREFFLQPGRYNLQDIPAVAEATNNVRLRIVDDLGEVRFIDFALFTDLELLAVGEHEFSYSLGTRRWSTTQGYRYDAGRPVFAAFHHYGLQQDLTMGGNLQLSEQHHMIGVRGVWASPVGSFVLDTAYSRNRGAAPSEGHAWRLSYGWTEVPGGPLRRAVDLNVGYTSRYFAPLGDGEVENTTAGSILLRYGQHLGPLTRLQLGASYRSARDDRADGRTLSAFLHRRIGRANLSLGLQHDRREGEEENSVNLSLQIPLGGGALGAYYDSGDRSTTLSYTRFDGTGIGSTGVNGGITLGPEDDSLSGALTYAGNRYTAGIDHRADRSDGATRDARTTLQLGTALVYADGTAALARPVSDSFAIVVPHPALAEVDLAADPIRRPMGTEVTYNAVGDLLGPPVVSDLRSYLYRSFTVEAPNAPTGISASNEMVNLHPSYRSGYRVQIGSGNNVSITGRLLAPNGDPVALGVGDVIGPNGATTKFFTNRGGRFYIERLAGGESYLLQLGGEQAGEVQVTLPKDALGLVRLEQLRLKPADR